MLRIERVLPGSTAERFGLESGDTIISINDHEINDVIDFRFYSADEQCSLTFNKRDSTVRKIDVDHGTDEDLGLEVEPLHIRNCRNQCIFCFVDQMPGGCRKSLYIKDDDYRASFLYGNYITLCNLSERDWERIFRQRLSPLYISVHATETNLRRRILGNKTAPDILNHLQRLAEGGIQMHTQIVLCPGVNDGMHLTRTVGDLADLFPSVASIAVVPVGITGYRQGLFPVKQYRQRGASRILDDCERLGRKYKSKFGTRLVFASDEFYVKAGRPFPSYRFYEDFPQVENGVGMVAQFLHVASRVPLPSKIAPKKITVVTGSSFSRILKPFLKSLERIRGALIQQVTVKNRFFGPSVTVSGLLSGSDILEALKGKNLGNVVLVPSDALKEDEDIFLDGMTLGDLERAVNATIRRVGSFAEIVEVLKEDAYYNRPWIGKSKH